MSLRRALREMAEVPRDLALGRYPPFVTGGELPTGDVPVFVFHSLDPESFERKLAHLAENGYRTLSGAEYLEVITGARPAPPRAVLLTFDDGRGSLWTVGGPLLRRHGMTGVVFLVPGRTTSRPGSPEPTWDDAAAGRATAATVLAREQGEGAFLSWEEVEALAREGVFEFHSHTLTHARIHMSPAIVDFLSPPARHGYAAMDVPLIRDDGRDLFAAEVPLGTPLLRSEPRTGEGLRFFEDPAVRRRCVEAAAAEGEAFFRRPDWRRRLFAIVRGTRVEGRRETPEEREASVRRELVESKRVLEERTGLSVVHLCYPWHVSGPTARHLAAEAGYRTAFGGKVPGTPVTRPGGDLQSIARIGEDYVELLPGRGRSSLPRVLALKWRRRLRGRA